METIGPVDWAIVQWASVGGGLLSGVVGPRPIVPTMPLFFLSRRAVIPSYPQREKENVFDWPSTGNSGQSMLVRSDMIFLTFWICIYCGRLGYP